MSIRSFVVAVIGAGIRSADLNGDKVSDLMDVYAASGTISVGVALTNTVLVGGIDRLPRSVLP